MSASTSDAASRSAASLNAATTDPHLVGKRQTPIPRTPSRRLRGILNLEEFEAAARRHLPRPIFGYVSAAAESGASLRRNREVFADYEFVPRVLVGVTDRSARTSLLGRTYEAPFGIAPMGISALSAYRGDVVQARAAAAAGIPMILSSSSLIPLEEVIAANPAAWFQAYLIGDGPSIAAMIERVARAGFETLVLTVDTPENPNKENYLRAGFSSPLKPSLGLAWQGVTHPRWLLGTFARTLLNHGIPHFENNFATRGVPIIARNVERSFGDRGALNWDHVSAIRRQWPGRIVVKGILSPDDARIAADRGMDAVVVSNHGGRQLDGVTSSLDALPAIVAAKPGIPIILDGGVRRGTDVLKALALGADFVLVGRPFNYAGAIGGEEGVSYAIELLKAEVLRNMAMLGINGLSELDAATHLVRRPSGARR